MQCIYIICISNGNDKRHTTTIVVITLKTTQGPPLADRKAVECDIENLDGPDSVNEGIMRHRWHERIGARAKWWWVQ